MDYRTATIEVSGANGFVELVANVTPYSITGLVVAARTLDSGNTVVGDQIAEAENVQAAPYVNYEIINNGSWDPLWCRNTVITVNTGKVRVALGGK